jgi:hypothetical protein
LYSITCYRYVLSAIELRAISSISELLSQRMPRLVSICQAVFCLGFTTFEMFLGPTRVSKGKLGVAQTIRKDTRVHVDEFGTSGSYLFIAGLMETYYVSKVALGATMVFLVRPEIESPCVSPGRLDPRHSVSERGQIRLLPCLYPPSGCRQAPIDSVPKPVWD